MDTKEFPSIVRMLERIATEMCDKYCKFPDQYTGDNDDENTEKLIEEHCMFCHMISISD